MKAEMKSELEKKATDIKKAENTRRIELGMLGELIDRYPAEAREKIRKRLAPNADRPPRNSLVLRE